MGVCTTRHWQTSGRLVRELNVFTVEVKITYKVFMLFVGELPKCSGLRVTPYALTFQCEGLHLEVRLTYDWESDGYEKLYEECMASNDEAEKKW